MAVALLGCIPGISTWAIHEGAKRIGEYRWGQMIARYNEDMHKLKNEWYAHNGEPEIPRVGSYHHGDSDPAGQLKCSHEPNKYPDGVTDCLKKKEDISRRYYVFLRERSSQRASFEKLTDGAVILAISALALSILFMPAAVKSSLLLGGAYVTCGLVSSTVGVLQPILSRIRGCSGNVD
ncbi:MAG: hypothetical protein Q8L98_01210 [Chlamydiales bacterium]|nr:hypothetical protein [Chlamydiales bacterium]